MCLWNFKKARIMTLSFVKVLNTPMAKSQAYVYGGIWEGGDSLGTGKGCSSSFTFYLHTVAIIIFLVWKTRVIHLYVWNTSITPPCPQDNFLNMMSIPFQDLAQNSQSGISIWEYIFIGEKDMVNQSTYPSLSESPTKSGILAIVAFFSRGCWTEDTEGFTCVCFLTFKANLYHSLNSPEASAANKQTIWLKIKLWPCPLLPRELIRIPTHFLSLRGKTNWRNHMLPVLMFHPGHKLQAPAHQSPIHWPYFY